MDDVQTATDPVLFTHLSENPPTEVPFFALDYREKPKCSVQTKQLDFKWLQLAEKKCCDYLADTQSRRRNDCRIVQPATFSSSMLLLWEFLLRAARIRTSYMYLRNFYSTSQMLYFELQFLFIFLFPFLFLISLMDLK